MFKLLRDFAIEEIFFYESRNARKEEKSSTDELPTTRFAVVCFFFLQVAQVKKAKVFFANELHTRAVEVREAKEAVESTRAGLLPQKGDVRKKRKENKKTKAGGLSPQEGDVRKKRKEKKKTKEGGLSPQEGDVRKRRKEKKKTKEGEKLAPAKARFRLPYTKNSFFFGSRVVGLGSCPTRLKYRLL